MAATHCEVGVEVGVNIRETVRLRVCERLGVGAPVLLYEGGVEADGDRAMLPLIEALPLIDPLELCEIVCRENVSMHVRQPQPSTRARFAKLA